MLYVWTSVSWGPERQGEGKCFLSVLIPLFFPFLVFFTSWPSFSSLLKIRAGEARPRRHVTAQEPNG